MKSITHDTTNTATKPQKKKRMRDRQQVAARNSEMGLQLRIPAPRTTPWPFLSSLQNPPTQNAQEAPVLIKPCQPTSNMSTCRVANLSSSHKISTPQPRRATPPPPPPLKTSVRKRGDCSHKSPPSHQLQHATKLLLVARSEASAFTCICYIYYLYYSRRGEGGVTF